MRRYAPPVPRAGAGVRNAVIAEKKYRRILGDIRRVADIVGGRPTRMQYNRLRSAAGVSSSSLLQHGLAWSTVVAEAMALDPAEAAAIQQESDEAFTAPPKRERPSSDRRRLALDVERYITEAMPQARQALAERTPTGLPVVESTRRTEEIRGIGRGGVVVVRTVEIVSLR